MPSATPGAPNNRVLSTWRSELRVAMNKNRCLPKTGKVNRLAMFGLFLGAVVVWGCGKVDDSVDENHLTN